MEVLFPSCTKMVDRRLLVIMVRMNTTNAEKYSSPEADVASSTSGKQSIYKHKDHFHKQKHIAVVTMGVKLGDETRGYTRFRYLSELLSREGFKVDLITTSFQHWEKAHRDTSKPCYQEHPFNVIFIDEPGYRRNLDLARIRSHAQAAKNLRALFETTAGPYDLIYAEIPPNDIARVCAEFAQESGIPFVADINDLWPEAMRMVVDIPVLSNIIFRPFTRDAKSTYQLLSAAVGTSDEYADRPAQDRTEPYPHATVYVGNDLAVFDSGVAQFKNEITKPKDEIWVSYAGTLGASYDLKTFVEAAALIKHEKASASLPPIRFKILGDGPEKDSLEKLAKKIDAPVDFLGYMDYEHMAAFLSASDIVVNSLVKAAVQSIVTKIGDYLASGNPMINTGSNTEFRNKVSNDGFGLNIEAEDPEALAEAVITLAQHASLRKIYGAKGRAIAEKEFDQPYSYQKIVDLIHTLI